MKLTASGADPDATEVAKALHVGELFAAAIVGVAITEVGDGTDDVGEAAPLGTAVGEPVGGVGEPSPPPLHDFARIEICSGDDPAELYTFSVAPSC